MPEYHGGMLAARIFLNRWSDTEAMKKYKAEQIGRMLGDIPFPIEYALSDLLHKAFYEGVKEEAAERDGLRT